MTVTRLPKSITFDAVNTGLDLAGLQITIVGITFAGTGLTAGQSLTVRDSATVGSGSIVADYRTEPNADGVDNADLWWNREPLVVGGLSIDNNAVAGTWKLTVFYR